MSYLRTLVSYASYEEDIKKSRFLAQAMPVATIDDAMRFVVQCSVVEATHHCWAYRIGEQYRFNDDGEPAGTAGRPILQAIEGQQCDQVIVVVTRWYGGIKLGAGGLVRAYSSAAANCLRLAPMQDIVPQQTMRFNVLFSELALVQARLHDLGASTLAEEFTHEGAILTVSLAKEQVHAWQTLFTTLTRGRGEIEYIDPIG